MEAPNFELYASLLVPGICEEAKSGAYLSKPLYRGGGACICESREVAHTKKTKLRSKRGERNIDYIHYFLSQFPIRRRRAIYMDLPLR